MSAIRMFAAACTVAAALVSGNAHALDEARALAVVASAADRVIAPAYFDLRARADWQLGAMRRLCKEPGADALDSARFDFDSFINGWALVEPFRFGPVMDERRQERFLSWPDADGAIEAAFATKDPHLTNLGTLVQQPAVLQGLGALEAVLFGEGSEELAAGGGFRCAWGRAIAANLERRAYELDRTWTDFNGFTAKWTQPGPGNADFATVEASLTLLTRTLTEGVATARRRLDFIGETKAQDRPDEALFARSAKTLDAVVRNIRTLSRLYAETGLKDLLADRDKALAEAIADGFEQVEAGLASLFGSLAEMLDDDDDREALRQARSRLDDLSELVGPRLRAALGLAIVTSP